MSPKRARLRVRSYEELAMLSHNMQSVYIDEDRVVQEYLHHLKKKDWNKEKEMVTRRFWS